MNMTRALEDIVIVGAGAAGIAAARRLADAGRDPLLVEARTRVGGRASTVITPGGWPIDLGCGWLHSADLNPLVSVAETLGFTVDRSLPPWRKRGAARNFSQQEQREFEEAQDAFYERLEKTSHDRPDRAASEALEPGSRWNPLIDAVSGYLNGVSLDELSSVDFERYRDSGVNWRVADGYGAFFVRWAQGLRVNFDCPVRLIDHSGTEIAVETDRGAIRAKSVIVTAPTDVLARETIRFRPALPDKIAAACSLPLGSNNKLFLRFDGAKAFEPDTRAFGSKTSARTGAYAIKPFGRPLVEAFYGGDLARDLEKEGLAGFGAFAIDELVAALGSDVRSRLAPIAASSWSQDPWSLGAYSHARVGDAEARAALAQPDNQRLLFAGEACSPHYFSTAHGAAESGQAAADFLIAGHKAA